MTGRPGHGGFPWAEGMPTVRRRLAVALLIGVAAAAVHYFRAAEQGGVSDFTALWHGARFLLEGQNPYPLIGPGRTIGTPSPVYYPVTAFVASLPLTVLPFLWAGTVFIFASAFLLAYGATKDGWHRLPIFPSIAFLTSAQVGQWSILTTAALFIPALAFLTAAKPQAYLPVVAASPERSTYVAAAMGAAVLIAISLLMMPWWPAEWWGLLRTSEYFVAPISRFGGPAIGLVLLRWRRPEAWLVFIAACLPQTWYPYNGLLLLAIAASYREACALSLVSSAGWLLTYLYLPGEMRAPETRVAWSGILIATGYLPAVIAVLRRPNEGPTPLWLGWLARGFDQRSARYRSARYHRWHR